MTTVSAVSAGREAWSPEDVGSFRETGYRLVRGLLGPGEARELAEAVPPLFAGDERLDGMHREREPGGAVMQVYLAHRLHPLFRRLAQDGRLAGPVRQLLGGGVYVWHSKVNVKQPFEGIPWLWHQDFGYWRLEGVRPELVSALVFLDRVTPLNGGMLLVPGSHRWGDVEHVLDRTTTVRPQRCVDPELLAARLGEDDVVSADGEPGDVLFLDCRLVHGSGHNMSPRPRRLFVVAYNRVDNAPAPDSSDRPDWVVARTVEPVA